MSGPGYSAVNPRIKVVGSLAEVFNTPYDPYNCVIYPRRLTADFNALAKGLGEQLNLSRSVRNSHELSLHELALRVRSLGGEAQAAGRIVIADMGEIEKFGIHPKLRVISPAGYKFKIAHAFHEDREKDTEYGRILCCYVEPVTESIRNEDAVLIGSQKYAAKTDAVITAFQPGDVWKHIPRNERGVPPFIHRAGQGLKPAEQPRLVLAAD
jgi:hypothetical protein